MNQRPATPTATGAGSPLIQYWDSEDVPGYIEARLAACRDGNSALRHLLFNRTTAEELIREHHGERHADAFRACAVPAMQADYFRYCAVHALGGVYVDADFGFRRPLRPLLEVDGQLFERPPRGPTLNGLFAFRSPGHPFLAMSIEVATSNIESRCPESVPLATGPGVFTGLVRLGRDSSLDAFRQSVEPRWRELVEGSWESFSGAFKTAITEHGPIERALEGVRIGSRAEMLTWVARPDTQLPYEREDSYWANWQGSIFGSPRVEQTR